MKKKFFLSILVIVCLLAGLIDGCKKDSLDKPPSGIATSFTEEFKDVYKLETGGWVIKDNSTPSASATWVQGEANGVKGGQSGFPAYSFTTSPDEYIAASALFFPSSGYNVSSWLITPVLSLTNGDKISFYSRADTVSVNQDRMQVRMSTSTSSDVGDNANSVGNLTTVLMDINSMQAAGGYPAVWTKYEHTFSGISGKIESRIAFRYFIPNTTASAGAIAIDQFKFEK